MSLPPLSARSERASGGQSSKNVEARRGTAAAPPPERRARSASQGRTSCSKQPKEKAAPRPPPPLQVMHLLDGEAAEVQKQLQDAAAASSEQAITQYASLVVVEVGEEALEDLFQQFAFQHRAVDFSCTAEAQAATSNWEPAEAEIVELRGRKVVVIKLPIGFLAAVHLRLVQRLLPDSIAAWSDWARVARKDEKSWYSAALPTVHLGLARPNSLLVDLAVNDTDGVSVLVKLKWEMPEQEIPDETIIWQYRWKRIHRIEDGDICASDNILPTVSGSGDGCRLGSPSWVPGPEMKARRSSVVTENFTLQDAWQGLNIAFAVRYRGESSLVTWSAWSDASPSVDMNLGEPEQPNAEATLGVTHSSADRTAAELFWGALLPARSAACGLQYRVQICERSCQAPVQVSDRSSPWRLLSVVEAQNHALSPEKLRCKVSSLRPATKYDARVLVRHFRIDCLFVEAFNCSFQTSPNPVEHNSPPVIALPESASLTSECTRLGLRHGFKLPGIVAQWQPAGLTAEYMALDSTSGDYAPSSWNYVHAQRNGLRAIAASKTSSDNFALFVPFPPDLDQILFRCRHQQGMLTDIARVVLDYGPPEAPLASLEFDDNNISVSLHTKASGKGWSHADRCEFASVWDGSCKPYASLVVTELIFGHSCALARTRLLASNPDFAIPALGRCRFQARLGDGLRWSSWSDLSEPLILSVNPPSPLLTSTLTVHELKQSIGCAEVFWQPFLPVPGLSSLNYDIEVAPVLNPDAVVRQFLHGGLAENSECCRTVLRRLVPGTEYTARIRACYARLARFSKEVCAQNPCSETNFWTSTIDDTPFEPPVPPVQLAPPSSRGGVDARVCWSWDFWLEPRAFLYGRSEEGIRYKMQWRSAEESNRTLASSQISKASTEWLSARPPVIPEGETACHWDLLGQLETASDGMIPPERIQLRFCIEDAQRIATTPRLWYSCASLPFVSAYAPPPKPRVTTQLVRSGLLELLVSFGLCDEPPDAAAPLPAWLVADDPGEGNAVVPDGLPKVPHAYGHRYAERFQIRHRLAGDTHRGQSRLMRPQSIDRDALRDAFADDVLPCNWRVLATKLKLSCADFADGERRVFSVRIGDHWRWSGWSVFSKPVTFCLPRVEASTASSIRNDDEACTLVASPYSPDQALLQWSALRTDLGVSVESFFWLLSFGPDGREAKDERQVVATHIEEPGAQGEPRSLYASVGHLQPGRQYCFMHSVRQATAVFGASGFTEISRSETIDWPNSASGNCTTVESMDLQAPKPCATSDELECTSARWRGRAVLLGWPRGVAVSDDPPLELQGCAVGSDPITGWLPVPWSSLRVQERLYILAAPLPFDYGRFRWYSRDRRIAGPPSEHCLAFAEPPAEPDVSVFYTEFAARIRVRVSGLCGESQAGMSCQVRWRRVRDVEGAGEEAGSSWFLLPRVCCFDSTDMHAECTLADVTVGEDDGLRLGGSYIFAARVGDGRRTSSWSVPARPVVFDIPAPVAPSAVEGEALLVEALSENSLRLCWPPLRATLELSTQNATVADRHRLEYRLDVSRCLESGGLERQATVFLDDDELGFAASEAVVHCLLPGARYFSALAVRFAQLGCGEWCKTGLKASFEMPASPASP